MTLQFTDGTDIYRPAACGRALQNVLEQLPPGFCPNRPISTGLGNFYYSVQYRAGATNKPATGLAQLIELVNREYHQAVAAPCRASRKSARGGYAIRHQPKPDALTSRMTFSDLADLVAERGERRGRHYQPGRTTHHSRVSRVASIEDLANLPLKFGAGVKPLLVRTWPRSRWNEIPHRRGHLNGRETVMGTTMMLAGQNSRQVAARVRRASLKFKPSCRRAWKSNSIRPRATDRPHHRHGQNQSVRGAISLSACCSRRGNWRAALIVATAIPLSVFFALAAWRVSASPAI